MVLQKQKYHFVLVHGGCHGAWCWYKLVDRLQNDGHQVTALDMAGAGQHPADPNTIATFEQYNQPLTDFFESLPKEDPSKVRSLDFTPGRLYKLVFLAGIFRNFADEFRRLNFADIQEFPRLQFICKSEKVQTSISQTPRQFYYNGG